MSRRITYVGGLEELERFRNQYTGRLVPDNLYVFGQWCDATEESDLMWLDLRRAFGRAKLNARQRLAVKLAMKLVPYAEIARQMDIDESTARQYIETAYRKLDALPAGNIGCWTTIVEACGGWGGVRCYVADIDV